LDKCINIIEEWSKENNLKINKKKSAIMEFMHRRSRTTQMKVENSYRDYPILDNYKYLGTWLSQKLELDPQIQFLEKKINFMKHKLNPCLYNATLELRKNLWQVFVVPLFEFALPIYFSEEAKTKRQKLERVLRGSFKNFTGLAKTVDTQLIDDLMGYNLEDRSKQIQYISEKKWEYRVVGKKYSPNCDPEKELAVPPINLNKCKYFSKEMIKYINLQTALCPKCKEQGIIARCTRDHLDSLHHIKISSVNMIVEHLTKNSKKEVINERNQKVSKCKNRNEMIQIFNQILDPNYNKIKQFFCTVN